MSCKIADSPYAEYVPGQLLDHLKSEKVEDRATEYSYPAVQSDPRPLKNKASFKTRPSDVRLPARIASPLIPYPESLKDYIKDSTTINRNKFHGHHTSQLDALATTFKSLSDTRRLPQGQLKFDLDSLKKFARQSFSLREGLIKSATSSFARRATKHDLSIAAGCEIPFSTVPVTSSEYLPFVIMIQRLRVHIAKEKVFLPFDPESVTISADEASYQMFANGVYLYASSHPAHTFYLLSCGGHFRFYHANVGYWFCGSTTYLDYIFSIADILNNLDVLSACEEYTWAEEIFRLMIKFAEIEDHHKDQVDFMKGIEGFLLAMSDYDEDYAMNWKPLLINSKELWELDMKISSVSYDFSIIFCILSKKPVHHPKESFFCNLIVAALKLTRLQLQEISSLHRLIFYAEVNARAGVEKFLKRVHTPRSMDPIAIKNITRYSKQLFLLSYKKKHDTLPNIIGPVPKVKLLETYTRSNDISRIEGLPLSWWDEIKIFDCMDNTLTDDPLEFAKDKGALKSDISFGPGDSRKELLQVIEKSEYKLKDFFSGRKFERLTPKVVETTQYETAEHVDYPARLIEKEREQKYEARLFANAELEDKHSLSLVAAKMKKALSYFDEQLMTPNDRTRKSLIHNASRDLATPDNYSLLLDIEGHNQSMQYENTSELCEFVGHLFGQDGWGDLPIHFSNLTVYHYDEYEDKAIISQGQRGGIEGWLNPLWTLHTTIMMKLLRIMTDLTIPKIMVYSDDVNAVVTIKQASEPMVQSVFLKIMNHCWKFGMIVKYSQTMMSKHRITILRQHYADGERADSTLKRLISMSAGNNPVLVSDELETAGISSASASALELSNHNEACSYLKNYKLGMLLVRLPDMILSRDIDNSMIGRSELPKRLANVLYYQKEDFIGLKVKSQNDLYEAAVNDIAAYLKRTPMELNTDLLSFALRNLYSRGISEERMIDSADRTLYLQIYDEFLQDLLFFWAYLPSSLGGLGASLHINLVLSGHSVGFTKAVHYLFEWIKNWACETDYFLRYFSTVLAIDTDKPRNLEEQRVVTTNWPNDATLTTSMTSIQQAIKKAVRSISINKSVHKLFELSDEKGELANELIDLFRDDFHTRIVQFYHENTSSHFVDLLLNKVETSSGLILKVRNITRLRGSIVSRVIENIRMAATTHRTYFFMLTKATDLLECLSIRKRNMFPKISFVDIEEILYDDKIEEATAVDALITVRRCAPTHYRNGIRVYDDPKVGNETLYKGELLDNSRMLGHKEELLAAKLVAVTKWFLTKAGNITSISKDMNSMNIVKACNLSLSTLTNQSFSDLVNFAPTETGGEILHRIPNIRFSTSTYIRAEMNKSLNYTTDLSQRLMTTIGLVDSNLNVDYLRMRVLTAAIIKDKYPSARRLVVRYRFSNYIGIKDVQFVKPKITSWEPRKSYTPYGIARGHILSEKRFRYLAHSYMFEENMNDWALMPNDLESRTGKQLGDKYIDDIILRYAKDLDKDYMMVDNRIIDRNVWKPLKEKLDSLDKSWSDGSEGDPYEMIRERLAHVMTERSKWSLVNPKNKLDIELQSLCLETLSSLKPKDRTFDALSQLFCKMSRARRHSRILDSKLSKYQQELLRIEQHKRNLALFLLAEYTLTFHFKTRIEGGIVTVDIRDSIEELRASGLGALSPMIISPHLQFQILVLGYEFVDHTLDQSIEDLEAILSEVSRDSELADIDLPINLPSLSEQTNLSGKEQIPASLDEIEYSLIKLPPSAMPDLDMLRPLCHFAQRCSTGGAAPETFTSYTGSDSLGAQIGLFKSLINEGLVDKSTEICDLTAGRGDGAYAMSHLDLKYTSFSRPDTFTRLQYHPDVQFKGDYDVFDGSTLKFVTGYDHVHVDISFTGVVSGRMIDLIFLLEEHNLQYSIRLGGVDCTGYDLAAVQDLPPYHHYLSYALNSQLKPYQIYLVGTPAETRDYSVHTTMRDSIAYRSMTLSFAKLLAPSNYLSRLEYFEPNSISIQMPIGRHLDDFLVSIGKLSLKREQLYYIDRYITEVGEEAVLAVVPNMLPAYGGQIILDRMRIFKSSKICPYPDATTDDIGPVSEKSRPHHEAHVREIIGVNQSLMECSLLSCDDVLLNYMRTRHPLKDVRSQCNVLLGLRQFCRSHVLSGHDALLSLKKDLESSDDVSQSLHQKEIFFAIKLLMLASKRDNFAYGVNYCRSLMARSPTKSKSLQRTLRIYRLISYLFPYIQYMLRQGKMRIQVIDAIQNELEDREVKKYKYKRPTEAPPDIAIDTELEQLILGDNLDHLFAGLEQYSQSLVELGSGIDEPATLADTLRASNLVFDIGIESRVNQMVEKLGLVPTGPHGIIDLGDADIIEADDW